MLFGNDFDPFLTPDTTIAQALAERRMGIHG